MRDRPHPPTQEAQMPVLTAHNDCVARVMQRHAVTQVELATAAQLSESVISRVINGTRVVTPEIVRALWQLTGDTEIIAMLTGLGGFTLVQSPGGNLSIQQAECLMVRACGRVVGNYQSPAADADHTAGRLADIDQAVNAMLAVRALLASPSSRPPQPCRGARAAGATTQPHQTLSQGGPAAGPPDPAAAHRPPYRSVTHTAATIDTTA